MFKIFYSPDRTTRQRAPKRPSRLCGRVDQDKTSVSELRITVEVLVIGNIVMTATIGQLKLSPRSWRERGEYGDGILVWVRVLACPSRRQLS
jgi:hypothetical protein